MNKREFIQPNNNDSLQEKDIEAFNKIGPSPPMNNYNDPVAADDDIDNLPSEENREINTVSRNNNNN